MPSLALPLFNFYILSPFSPLIHFVCRSFTILFEKTSAFVSFFLFFHLFFVFFCFPFLLPFCFLMIFPYFFALFLDKLWRELNFRCHIIIAACTVQYSRMQDSTAQYSSLQNST